MDQVSMGSTGGSASPEAEESSAKSLAGAWAGDSLRLATSCLSPSPLEAEAGTTSMKSWLRKPTACPSQRRRR